LQVIVSGIEDVVGVIDIIHVKQQHEDEDPELELLLAGKRASMPYAPSLWLVKDCI